MPGQYISAQTKEGRSEFGYHFGRASKIKKEKRDRRFPKKGRDF